MNRVKNWFVYMLQCKDGTYYTGITNNLEKRLKAHSSGKAAKYTAGRLPVKLCYSMGGYSESQARKNEFLLKSLTKEAKEKLIRRVGRSREAGPRSAVGGLRQ
jgi:putative endonuclease